MMLLGVMTVIGSTATPVRAEPDPVQVFFSREPESFDDFSAVFPVTREASPGALMEDAIAALIAGPTAAERAAGYFSEFRAIIVGTSSTCKGQDFLLMVTLGIATVQLCRQTASAGIGQDARAQSEINATLMQFPGVSRVIVLSSAGHCLFDLSG
jgi:hypothetical protein